MSLRTTCVHTVEPVSAVTPLKIAIRNGRWEAGRQGYALTNSVGILYFEGAVVFLPAQTSFLSKVLIGLIK